MMKDENTSLKEALNKQEVEQFFSKIFQDQSNVFCFECGKKCKQWADKSHAIFLCLDCAAEYKQLKWAVTVKSINLDLWSKKQLQLLSLGGNRRFKEFLSFYQFSNVDYKTKLKSKAAQYYRILLNQQVNGRQPPEAPSKEIGRLIAKQQVPITNMTPEQLLSYTKEKAFWLGSKTKQETLKLGSKTKQYGGKAFNKIQHKITSGQLKEDAKKLGKQVKSKAKSIWSFALSKITSSKTQQQPKEPQL